MPAAAPTTAPRAPAPTTAPPAPATGAPPVPDAVAGLDDVTRRMVEQTLVPSPNVTALAGRRGSGFVDRLRPSASGLLADVAELFHLNSKLVRQLPDERFPDSQAAAIRDWFFATCGGVRDQDLTGAQTEVRLPHAGLPPGVAAGLAPFGPAGPLARLLYTVDLGVLLPDPAGSGALACRQPAGAGHLWVEHRLGPEARAALRATVPDPVTAPLLVEHPTFVLIGVPWRTMLFSGPRGYRRMLMDAGVLLNALGAAVLSQGLEPRPVFDFYDEELDELLGNDGVERSAVALLVARQPEGK